MISRLRPHVAAGSVSMVTPRMAAGGNKVSHTWQRVRALGIDDLVVQTDDNWLSLPSSTERALVDRLRRQGVGAKSNRASQRPRLVGHGPGAGRALQMPSRALLMRVCWASSSGNTARITARSLWAGRARLWTRPRCHVFALCPVVYINTPARPRSHLAQRARREPVRHSTDTARDQHRSRYTR